MFRYESVDGYAGQRLNWRLERDRGAIVSSGETMIRRK